MSLEVAMDAREALLAAAEEITRELICCDVYERDKGTERAGTTHDICFWSGAARAIVLDHAEKLKVEEPESILGLCGNREEHNPHVHQSASLGVFYCHADQSKRLPFAAEKRR